MILSKTQKIMKTGIAKYSKSLERKEEDIQIQVKADQNSEGVIYQICDKWNPKIEVSFKDIYDLSFETEKSLLQDVSLFDVYTGSKLPKGKKSYAVSFTLKSEKETLTDKQIEKIMGKFQEKFETKLGAELR